LHLVGDLLELNKTFFQVIRGICCGDYLSHNLIMSILILYRIQLTAITMLFHRCMELHCIALVQHYIVSLSDQ